MIRQITLSVALSFTLIGRAQEFLFPTTSGRWLNAYYTVVPFPPPAVYTLNAQALFCSSGPDTLIGGTAYQRISFCGGAYKGAVRNDGGRVLYVPADSLSEYVLYDFTLEVGETISNVYYEQGFGQNDGYLIDVTCTGAYDDTEHEGRRRIQLSDGAEWLEGVGNLWGLFTEPWVNISNYALALECMSEEDLVLYPALGPGACDLGMGVQANGPTNAALTASPNPTNGPISFTNSEDLITGLELFGPDGKTHRLAIGTPANTVSVDLSDLACGVYMVRSINSPVTMVERVVVMR